MSAALKPRISGMDAEAFLEWTLERADDTRYELLDGEPVAMAPQTFGHADDKYRIARACTSAIEAAGLACRVIVDGMGVRASARRVFTPDLMIQCGSPIERDARILDDPLAIIEVLLPSIRHTDTGVKFSGYFSRPSLRHYLIVAAAERQATHHERDDDGVITSRIVGSEPVRFDPPGLQLGSLFAAT